jgi:anti-sigma B factor antagonist
MKLRFEEHGPLCVVQVEGELVGESSDSLRRACRERLEGGSRDFILDVSTTSGIDSAGLEALLDLADAATERRGRCLIAGPEASLKTVLDITRVSDRLEIHDEVASATRVLR